MGKCDPSTCISFGGENAVVEQVIVETVAPPIRPRKQLPRPLEAKVWRAYSKYMREWTDPYSYGWEFAGERPQRSAAELNRHFAAVHARHWGLQFDPAHFLAPLSAARLRNAAAGREVLRLRSRWHNSEENRLLSRLDLDRHHGERDVEAAEAWVMAQFAGAVDPYWCDSHLGRGGHSGYFSLVISTYTDERTGEVKPIMSRRRANRRVVDLHYALRALARLAGHQTGVEVKGGYLLTTDERDENGMPLTPKKISKGTLDGQFMVKNPVIATAEDMARLVGAKIDINHHVIDDIISRGQAAIQMLGQQERRRKAEFAALLAEDDAIESDDDEPATGSPTPRKKSSFAPREKANKAATKASCVVAVVHRLGIRTEEALREREEEIKEAANQLYIDRGFGDDVTDAQRRKGMDGAYRFVRRTFDPAKIGKWESTPAPTPTPSKYETWFTDAGDDNDAEVTSQKIASVIPGHVIRAANADLRRRGQPILSYKTLAVAALTLAKNETVDEKGNARPAGPAPSPVTAIVRMCNHRRFGLGVSGSTIRATLNLLCLYRIHETDHTYRPGQCRRWTCLRPHWFHFHRDHAAAIARRVEMGRLRKGAPATVSSGAGGYATFSCHKESEYWDAIPVVDAGVDDEGEGDYIGVLVDDAEFAEIPPEWE